MRVEEAGGCRGADASRRARTALAVVLLVPLLEAGCGGGPSTPTPPIGPGTPPGGGGSSQPVGTLTRGPYLQHAETGVTVVWYTEAPTDGRVRWYLDDDTAGEVVSSTGIATRHEAVISPLRPGARYTYRMYSGRGLLAGAAGTVDFSFRAPEPDVLRFVVFGDSGLGTPGQLAVANAIGAEAVAPDLAMIVGDVIYPPADDASYDPRFFTPYRTLLPRFPFYAAPGNHDYEILAGKPFFDVFTLPRNGPSGLAPESSYSLERAGVQMIVHDTNQSDRDAARPVPALAHRDDPAARDVPPRLPAPLDVLVRAQLLAGPVAGACARSSRRSTPRPVSTSSSTATITCTSAPGRSGASST